MDETIYDVYEDENASPIMIFLDLEQQEIRKYNQLEIMVSN